MLVGAVFLHSGAADFIDISEGGAARPRVVRCSCAT
jgi:hypothetical protein